MREYFTWAVFIVALGASQALFSAGPAATEKKVFSIPAQESCVNASCHADLAKKKFIHKPASDGSLCLGCHQMPEEGKHSFKLTMEGGDLCAVCHGIKADKQYKHFPVEKGLCTFCHDPHQSDNPKQLVKPPTSELCFSCHNEGSFKGTNPHGPVSEGKCLECHHPHTSDNVAQLLKPPPELCFGCHDARLEDPKGVAIPSIKAIFDNKELVLHRPFAEGRCTGCHSPHPTDTHRLLVREYPGEFYAAYSEGTYELCIGCHKQFRTLLSQPRTLTDTGFRNGNLNLHYRHVARPKGRTCRACHEHHGAKNPKLIRFSFSFGNRVLPLGYEKTETGGACSPACHPSVKYDRYEPDEITFKVTPREGEDATKKELELSREREMKGKEEDPSRKKEERKAEPSEKKEDREEKKK